MRWQAGVCEVLLVSSSRCAQAFVANMVRFGLLDLVGKLDSQTDAAVIQDNFCGGCGICVFEPFVIAIHGSSGRSQSNHRQVPEAIFELPRQDCRGVVCLSKRK